jgi:hypothetical protein
MALTILQKKLESSSGLKLKLTINDNRSTMLSVKWEPDCTKVSLHRIFLQAPKNVMEALACYLRREDKIIAPSVKAFIEANLQKLDYSHLLDRKKLCSQGSVYNLQKIYNGLNEEYFQGKLNLLITWFGKPMQRNRSRVTFGLYYDPLRLIKINRLLDHPSFPDYLISYVIYHEMLHHVCPAYFDDKGQHHIHSKEFKEKEVKFRYYDLAQNWIKEHQTYFFAELD